MRVHHHCMNVHDADCDAVRGQIAASSCSSRIPIRMPPFDLQWPRISFRSANSRFEFCVFVGMAVLAEVKDFKQFGAWLKANPDQATSGVPSNGTIPHLACTHKLIMSAWLNGNTCRKNCRNVSGSGSPCAMLVA